SKMLAAIGAGVRQLLMFLGGLAVLVGFALTWAHSRTLVRPVREITDVAYALARGDVRARTRSTRDDELGALGRAIDEMADDLAERHRSLRAEEARLR